MEELRFGVLGCADIAARRMIPAIAAAGHRLVAVASRTPGKAAGFADRFGAEPVEGYEALLGRSDLDAVYVPLPVAMHAEWAGAALEAGHHVLVEKSLTGEAAAARRLAGLARARGKVLMENFAFLHHSQHRAVLEAVASGAVGEPRAYASEFGIPPTDRSGIRYRPELGGGCLLETGTYPIRAARLFLDTEVTVAGAVLRYDEETGVEVAGSALLADSAGVTAHCTFGFTHHYRCTYAVWGSAGRLSLDWAFTPPSTVRPVLRVERQDHREERVLAADDQFRNMVRAFAEAVRDGAIEPHAVDVVRQATLLEDVRARARVVHEPAPSRSPSPSPSPSPIP